MQNATITTKFNSDANFKRSHRKENNSFYEYSAIVKTENGFKCPVTIRLYYTSTGGSNTAAFWINDSASGTHLSATGSAGGGGYHRPSAAAAEAIRKTGIVLSEDISGRGDSAIETAVKAVAVALGYDEANIYVHKANA